MNAYDLYEFFIEPADLKGQAHRVKIIASYVKESFNPQSKQKEKQIRLRFAGKQKVLGLNKTRAGAMIEITGTPEYEKWVGVEIIIRPGRQSNKDTVVIEAVQGPAPAQTQAPASQPEKKIDGNKLYALTELAETDLIAAYSGLWQAAGLTNEDQQAILKECSFDMYAAFQKIAKQYGPVIG